MIINVIIQVIPYSPVTNSNDNSVVVFKYKFFDIRTVLKQSEQRNDESKMSFTIQIIN